MYHTNVTFVLYGCYATFDSSFELGMLYTGKFNRFIGWCTWYGVQWNLSTTHGPTISGCMHATERWLARGGCFKGV
jgi:hypothetical protein